MADATPSASTPPPIGEFRVVCKGDGGTAYVVHRAAIDPEAAMSGARRAGHFPILCLPYGLARADETSIIKRWRMGSTTCAACGYSLEGLENPKGVTCPECGVGTMPPGRGRPHCSKCGYCLSGIAVGEAELRCPECGSDDPYLKRR